MNAAQQLLVWGALSAALVACNRPKQQEPPTQSPPATRSQSIATREQAERSASEVARQAAPTGSSVHSAFAPGPTPASAPQSGAEQIPGRAPFSAMGSPDACSLSLAGSGWVADCGFNKCPKEFLAGLLLSDTVVLKGTSTGFELLARRSQPPQVPYPAMTLSKSPSGWSLLGLQGDTPVACTVAGEVWSTAHDSMELPVDSLGIRSHVGSSVQND